MSYSYEKFNTNNELASELLFKIQNNDEALDARQFISRALCFGSIEPLRFVARYLVNRISNPTKAKELLDKYTIIAIYAALRYKNEALVEGLTSCYLNDIYDNGLTMEKLNNSPDDSNLFHRLLALGSGFKDLKDELFKRIRENFEKTGKASDSFIPKLEGISCYRMDFFRSQTRFVNYEKMKRSSDLLIAEARSYSKKRCFSFEIPTEEGNYDEFLKNVLKYESLNPNKTEIKNYEQNKKDVAIVVAHLVNDAIATNTPLNQVPTINSSELKVFELNYDANLTRGKGIIVKPELLFLAKRDNGLYYPVLDKINEFKVKYNNEPYLISRSGLKKL